MASKSDLNTYFKNETKINTQGFTFIKQENNGDCFHFKIFKNFIAKHNNIPPY